MSLKRFVTPPLVSVLVLVILYISGIDRITTGSADNETNLRKYKEVQSRIIESHVDKISIEELFKNSMRGFASNISDSTLDISGTPLDTTFSDLDVSSLRQSYAKFEQAYIYLYNQSGEEEDMTKRTEDAINAMFRPLDPHSVYIKPETSEQIQDQFSGKFEGIGIQFQVIDDTITVISAISGGPSEKLGIQSGDRIVEIDRESSVGFSEQDVVSTLRGPKGTNVTVGILRPGNERMLDFEITRDEIPLYTLDSSYMLDDDKTGYVRVNRFASTTHEEFTKAMRELRQDGMERLILDLRGNPGGYLEQAVRMTNDFFPRGTILVATQSRHARFTSEYRARYNGPYREMPLMVLVDEGSASGSEIVSGAIQDHDRGLVVGRRTFGKGLVQQQYELPDNSNIRITISRYLTPSGRAIQKPFSKGREEYAYEIYSRDDNATGDVKEFIENIPDSLRYKTAAGREVYGGGGVIPDHIIDLETTNELFVLMRRNNIGSAFVRDYIDRNGSEFRSNWEHSFDDFRSNFSWSEKNQGDLLTRFKENGLVVSDTVSTPNFDESELYLNESMLQEQLAIPLGFMKADLARQVWGNEHFYPVINDEVDFMVNEAMTLWPEVQKLQTMREEVSSFR